MRVIALIATLSFAGAAQSHDVWIQPATFVAQPDVAVPLTIFVGHAELRQRWGVASSRIVRFDDIGVANTRDRRAEVRTDAGTEDARLRFVEPGTHMLAMTSTQAFSDLPPIRYNDFVTVEGLTAASDYRSARGLSDTPGRETYSRCAKALVRVGPTDGPRNTAVSRPAGLPLEIVPLHDPYTLKAAKNLPVQILYRGKPLAGALVKLTNLDYDTRPVAMQRTDAAGRTEFNVPPRGKWLINTVWSVPVAGNPKADFETLFSSLTFGFQ